MKSEMITIKPSDWLIVEGLFVMHDARIRELFSLSAFIDAQPETRLERRKYRDETVRGYSPDEVEYQWNNHVTPCFKNYIEPFKEQSSFIYRNDKNSEKDFASLMETLSEKTMTIK